MGRFRTGLKQPKTKSQSMDVYRKVTKGYKSRGNWNVGICLKDCVNREKMCEECLGFNRFVPNKEEVNVG